jgi:hypothetical protein
VSVSETRAYPSGLETVKATTVQYAPAELEAVDQYEG